MPMTLNLYKLRLDSIDIAFQYDITIDALLHLRGTIERVFERTDEITKTLAQDNAQWIWEDTNASVDALRGSAFVICQAAITSIVSRVKALHEYARCCGVSLSSVPNNKAQLLAFRSAPIPSTTVTQIEAIEALANYFKHHDEWPAGWINPDARSRPTIAILQTLGFQYGNPSILADAAAMFQSNLFALANAVNEWHGAIVNELKKEVTSLRLL